MLLISGLGGVGTADLNLECGSDWVQSLTLGQKTRNPYLKILSLVTSAKFLLLSKIACHSRGQVSLFSR